MWQLDDNTNDPLTLFITTPPPPQHTQWKRVTFHTCSCAKGQTGGKKRSLPTCLPEKENRKTEFKAIGVFPCLSTSPTSSSPVATPAYWSGIVCQLKSPQYVTSVLSRLHIHSLYVTLNTDRFKLTVIFDLFNPPLVFLWGFQIKPALSGLYGYNVNTL